MEQHLDGAASRWSEKLPSMSIFGYLPARNEGESCHHHGGDSIDAALHYLEERTRTIISSSQYYCGARVINMENLGLAIPWTLPTHSFSNLVKMYIGYVHPSMAVAETGNITNAEEV